MPTDRDDDLLRRHLLGELPEEEAMRLEERLLLEDDLFELAEAVEADLVADAAEGGLAAAERQALTPLAATARGRRAAALARDLSAIAREGAPVVPFPARRATGRPPMAGRWLRLAVAACLAAALAAAAWVVLEGRGLRQEIQALRPDAREIERRESELRRLDRRRRGPAAERQAALPPATTGDEGAALPPLPPPGETAPPRIAAEAPRAAAEASVLLSLATLRSGGAAARVALAPDTARLKLAVDLGLAADEPTEYAAYTAVLRDGSGREVWRGEGLLAGRDGVLRLTVPAASLAAGRYELAVQGLSADGVVVDDLGYPELEVVRP